MKCNKCKTEFNKDTYFCTKCGNKINIPIIILGDLLAILLYFLAIFLFLDSLTYLFEDKGFISGILMLICSIFTCPITFRFIGKYIKYINNLPIRIIIIFFTLIIGASIAPIDEDALKQAEAQKAYEEKVKQEEAKRLAEEKAKQEEAKKEQLKIEGENNFIKIKKAYDNNEISANNTYKGNTYNLYGKVVGIKESGLFNSLLDNIGITIEVKKDGEYFYAFCSFPKSERDKLSILNEGDYLLFTGKCYSWGNYEDCKVL